MAVRYGVYVYALYALHHLAHKTGANYAAYIANSHGGVTLPPYMKFFYGEFAGAQPLFYERYVGFEIFGKSLARTSHNRFGGRLGYGTLFPVLGVYGYAVGYAVKKNYGVALQNVINRFALFYYLGFAYHQNIGEQIIQTRVFAPLARTRTKYGAQSISVA